MPGRFEGPRTASGAERAAESVCAGSGIEPEDDSSSGPPLRESMVVRRAAKVVDPCAAEELPGLEFDSLTIQRESGAQPTNDEFVDWVHGLTLRAVGIRIPRYETETRLSRANLGHYVFVERRGSRDLIGYSLNEIFPILLEGSALRVNYFCSAFLLPETRNLFSLYAMLGALRVIGREEMLMMRTQNPLVMRSFFRLCQRHGYRAFSPASTNVPRIVREALVNRFGNDDFVHRRVYPGRVSPVEVPRTRMTSQLMGLIDPDAGDSCVFCALLREYWEGGRHELKTRLRRGSAA